MPNQKKVSKKKFIIIGILVLVVICAGVTAYILYAHFHNAKHFNPNNPSSYQRRGNFTFNNATLNQVTSYLNNNTDTQGMISYCQQTINMLYCRYYCMKINPNNSVCSQLPMQQYRMNSNYTGAPPQ